MADLNNVLYCICKQPYDPQHFMIECDKCSDWFHGSCVNVLEHEAYDIDLYHCPECQKSHGPSKLKKQCNWHRHNYADPSENSKVVESGTAAFIDHLKSRAFVSPEGIVHHFKGFEMTVPWLETQGFSHPIIVDNPAGLEIKLPPEDFSVKDIEHLIGCDRELDVIDVARQTDSKMKMSDWTNYYSNPDRKKVMNVISLEFSDTSLSKLVTAPKCVRDLDWVPLYWPTDQLDEWYNA